MCSELGEDGRNGRRININLGKVKGRRERYCDGGNDNGRRSVERRAGGLEAWEATESLACAGMEVEEEWRGLYVMLRGLRAEDPGEEVQLLEVSGVQFRLPQSLPR